MEARQAIILVVTLAVCVTAPSCSNQRRREVRTATASTLPAGASFDHPATTHAILKSAFKNRLNWQYLLASRHTDATDGSDVASVDVRDARLGMLDEFLRGLPDASSTRVVIIDRIHGPATVGDPSPRSVLCGLTIVNSPLERLPDSLGGSVRVSNEEFAFMLRDLEPLLTKRSVDLQGNVIHSPVDLTIIRYFDGNRWRATAWRGFDDNAWASHQDRERYPGSRSFFRIISFALSYLPVRVDSVGMGLTGWIYTDGEVERDARDAGFHKL